MGIDATHPPRTPEWCPSVPLPPPVNRTQFQAFPPRQAYDRFQPCYQSNGCLYRCVLYAHTPVTLLGGCSKEP